jgi:hypothetical protein
MPLWSCPRCGAKLLVKNLSHACGDFSVERFLRDKTAAERALFARFESLIARCGPYSHAPAKTRVAFMVDVRFASVNRVGHGTLDVHFVLPRKLSSPRFRRIEPVGKLFVHHVRLTSPRDCDRQLSRWVLAAYREYGVRKPKPARA